MHGIPFQAGKQPVDSSEVVNVYPTPSLIKAANNKKWKTKAKPNYHWPKTTSGFGIWLKKHGLLEVLISANYSTVQNGKVRCKRLLLYCFCNFTLCKKILTLYPGIMHGLRINIVCKASLRSYNNIKISLSNWLKRDQAQIHTQSASQISWHIGQPLLHVTHTLFSQRSWFLLELTTLFCSKNQKARPTAIDTCVLVFHLADCTHSFSELNRYNPITPNTW